MVARYGEKIIILKVEELVHRALVAIRIIPGNRKVCSALSPGAAALSAAVLLPCLPTFSLTTPTHFEIYYSQSTNAEISRQLII